jgi:hypothetical protein
MTQRKSKIKKNRNIEDKSSNGTQGKIRRCAAVRGSVVDPKFFSFSGSSCYSCILHVTCNPNSSKTNSTAATAAKKAALPAAASVSAPPTLAAPP